MKSLSSYRFFLFLIIAGFATPSFAYDSGVAGKSYVDSIAAALTESTNTINTKTDKKIPAEPGNIAVLNAAGNLDDGVVSIGFIATELSEKVSKVSTESVGGVKTFSEIPLIPTAALPTAQ